jgi:hypothetical protein
VEAGKADAIMTEQQWSQTNRTVSRAAVPFQDVAERDDGFQGSVPAT